MTASHGAVRAQLGRSNGPVESRREGNIMQTKPPIITLFPELEAFSPSDFARIGTTRPTLMIAMTARTGSTHLCSGLSSVLPIGKPTELFNARDTLVWEKQQRGVNTFEELLSQYYSESDHTIVFKTCWLDFDYFKDKVFTLFPNLKIIYLNRLDIEAQAVSLFKAVITKKWHNAGDSIQSEEPFNVVLEKFDLVRICSIIKALEREKTSWEKFFFTHRLMPARINYEDFTTDLAAVVTFVAHNIGFTDVDASKLKSDYSALSDSINEEWLRSVRDYRSGQFYLRHSKKNAEVSSSLSSLPEPLVEKSAEA
jgi:LPS sulfotransferase NodH